MLRWLRCWAMAGWRLCVLMVWRGSVTSEESSGKRYKLLLLLVLLTADPTFSQHIVKGIVNSEIGTMPICSDNLFVGSCVSFMSLNICIPSHKNTWESGAYRFMTNVVLVRANWAGLIGIPPGDPSSKHIFKICHHSPCHTLICRCGSIRQTSFLLD